MRRQGRVFGLWLVGVAFVVGTAGVPLSAASFDLSNGGSAIIDGAIVTPYAVNFATGTGRFDPFVRIHREGEGIESGYNTAGDREFDTMGSPWTHSLLISDVPTVEVGGVLYREFLLDISQQGGSPLLSLDELVISLETAPNLTGHPGPDNYQNFSDAVVFSLDGMLVDNSIIMDATYFKGPGNGGSDLRVLVLEEDFTPHLANQYVYLYSVFGEIEAANDGFEEWGVAVGGDPTPPIPAPGAVLLASLGIGLIGWLRQKKLV